MIIFNNSDTNIMKGANLEVYDYPYVSNRADSDNNEAPEIPFEDDLYDDNEDYSSIVTGDSG